MSPRRKPAFQDFQEFSGSFQSLSLVLEREPVPYWITPTRGGAFRACPLSGRALGLSGAAGEPVPCIRVFRGSLSLIKRSLSLVIGDDFGLGAESASK